MMDTLGTFLALAVASTVPIMAAACGGAMAEKARSTNISLDGTMLIAALVALAVTERTGSAWAGLTAAVIAGGVYALVLAAATFWMGCDIIIAGIALNLLATGAVMLVTSVALHAPGTYSPPGVPTLPRVGIGPLAAVPLLGPALDNQSVLVYLAAALVALSWATMRHTVLGVWIVAVGESPDAVAAAGLSPVKVRTAAILASGLASGLAGAFLTISSVTTFNTQTTNGLGFIAFAAVIFGRATVIGATLASILFGLATAASLAFQGTGFFDAQLTHAWPYVATVVALGLIGVTRARSRAREPRSTNYLPAIVPKG
ncbi:MAG: ABC transporter permease [Bifidobacteriaceae bacterium]|jgi:simple sugar transport system permease protein|nr:ABC transporter permease [Bifidobacteriaceae bacterium]